MSVEPTTTDSTDVESSAESQFEEDVEAALDELNDRFEQFSKTYEDKLILIPETTYINKDGRMTRRIITGSDRQTMYDHNFTEYMTTQTGKGVGIKFWFNHKP